MIMMGLKCISVSRRGNTKETKVKLFTNGNAGKKKVKKKRMFVGGNGFRAQKVEAKGKKMLVELGEIEENEVKLSGNGNLRWQKRGCIQKEL